jgi:hypothetical protein
MAMDRIPHTLAKRSVDFTDFLLISMGVDHITLSFGLVSAMLDRADASIALHSLARTLVLKSI